MAIDRECVQCNGVFYVDYKSNKKKYCPVACRESASKARSNKKRCPECREQYTAKPSAVAKGNAKYCSRECFNKNRKSCRIRVKCKQCGSLFVVRPSEKEQGRKYCSRECSRIAKYNQVQLSCSRCNKNFSITSSEHARGGGVYCGKECFDKTRIINDDIHLARRMYSAERRSRAADNNNKSGVKPLGSSLRKKVWKRDGYKCHYCNVKTSAKPGREQSTVDHIVPVKDGGDDSECNLITACKRCNSKKSAKPYTEYMASLGRLPLAIL